MKLEAEYVLSSVSRISLLAQSLTCQWTKMLYSDQGSHNVVLQGIPKESSQPRVSNPTIDACVSSCSYLTLKEESSLPFKEGSGKFNYFGMRLGTSTINSKPPLPVRIKCKRLVSITTMHLTSPT